MQHFIVKWRRPRKAALLPELNTYTETPEGFLSGFYPGSKGVEGYKISFDIKLQNLAELNNYPVVVTNQYPGWLVKPIKKIKFRFSLQSVPELNEYRQVGSPYPSWLESKANKTDFKRKLLSIEELNFYPQIVVSPALLPALILERAIGIDSDNTTKRKFTISTTLRMVLGVDPAALPNGVGFSTSMTNNGLAKIGLMFNDGIGEVGIIANDGIGLGSTMSNNGIGKVGLITNNGIGETGEI